MLLIVITKKYNLTLSSSSLECDPLKEFACSPVLSGPGLGQCVSLAFVCDGVEQCLNGRDEADCCNNYCDDGVTCIQDEREGIQCDLKDQIRTYRLFMVNILAASRKVSFIFNCSN